MLILNFSHPLTNKQSAQIEGLTDHTIERIVGIDNQIDPQQPLTPQVAAMADEADLSSAAWQTLPLLIIPPAAGRAPRALRLLPARSSHAPRARQRAAALRGGRGTRSAGGAGLGAGAPHAFVTLKFQ